MRRFIRPATIASVLLATFFESGFAQNQSLTQQKIVVESVVISGTQAIDSTELAEITNRMTSSTLNDDAGELQERVRALFQDHGYFQAQVQKLDIKAIDPLASPKTVELRVEVNEGPRCRLSSIEFTGNHALSSREIRAKFPVKAGDLFVRGKIATGLESMQHLYGSVGFLEAIFVPEVKLDSTSTVKLSIEVQEGPQYRMDKLEISGPAEVAKKLQTGWELAPGVVFDASYMASFLEKNASLLPADFTLSSGVELFTDCRDATVSVHLHLAQDPQHAVLDRTQHVDCAPLTQAEN